MNRRKNVRCGLIMTAALLMSVALGSDAFALTATVDLNRGAFTGWGTCNQCWCGERWSNSDNQNQKATFTDTTPTPVSPGVDLASIVLDIPHNMCNEGTFVIFLNGVEIVRQSGGQGCCSRKKFGPYDVKPGVYPAGIYQLGGTNTVDILHLGSGGSADTAFYSDDPMITLQLDIGIPALITSPEDASFTNAVTPEFRWNDLSALGVTSYRLEVAETPFFDPDVIDATVNGTQYTPSTSLGNGITYYARVTPIGIAGDILAYISDFTVDTTPPHHPVLESPADEAEDVVETPTFDWQPLTSGSE
ncbi:MAG: hypothetical protein ABII00_09265 [Elusimicrobiota bacterium]